MTDSTRDFDVILFGPTGVTGREVARHLAQRAPELGLTWAVAGRNRERIAETLDAVDAVPAEILIADVRDETTIEAMARRGTTIANLVGPYASYGEPVYAACARAGTHSVDPCGETDWIKTMIDRFDDIATENESVIVPTAGFEALPFDLGVLVAAHHLFERTGEPVVEVDVAVSITSTISVQSAADAVSGGTLASGLAQIRRGERSASENPYLLDTPTSRARGRYDLRPRKHSSTGQWLAPMFPSPFLNPAIVHRTAALLRDTGDPIFGDAFLYREGTVAESMAPAPLAGPVAAVMSIMSTGMGLLGRAPSGVRNAVADAVERRGPAPGEGPRPADLDRWSYRLDIRATNARGGTQDVVVDGAGHPGYKSTATMLAEAAMALADPSAPVPDGAGFLTPGTALGLGVLDRLEAAGLRFSLA